MIGHLGVDPATSLFVEDMARNLSPAKALGMTTVWLDNGSESGHRDHRPEHVDFHVTDIADWLRSEERRGGNGCASTGRSWGSRDHYKKKHNKHHKYIVT